MTTRRWAIAAGMALTAAGLSAQSSGGFGGGGGRVGGVMEFQQAATMGTTTVRGTAGRTSSNGPLAVIGRPFSATEVRKSIQKLGDGTEITSSDTNLFYRDSQGRSRVEQTCDGRSVVGILDPVSMVFLEVNAANKTVTKIAISAGVTSGGISVSNCQISRSFGLGGVAVSTYTVSGQRTSTAEAGAVAVARKQAPSMAATGSGGGGGGGGVATAGGRGGAVAGVLMPSTSANNYKTEDLGVQSTNGVLAVGRRTTVTIPQGQIGNNRDIHVVNEHWYSEDLSMVVKTLNSDPRFGDNIYELTGVTRNEPDAALFQVPAGYTVVEGGRGGGGGFIATPIKQ